MEQNQYTKQNHTVLRLCGIALTVLVTLCILVVSSHAYDDVTEISITVGFWGDEGYVKKEVSLSELERECGTYREMYTWINQGSSPGITEAEGIYVLDVMYYCGIDPSSVYYYNFQTMDSATYANSNQQWTRSQLFGARYSYANCFQAALEDYQSDPEDYMDNPERHYTISDFFDFSNHKYSNDAWNNRYRVEPMLALKTRSTSWRSYVPASSLDYSNMSSNGKPILLFGQTGRNDITRNLMAQMVKSVHIWFNGYPDIELSSDDLTGKVGSEKRYTVTINTPDEFLSEQVAQRLEIRSSNGNVAEVDQQGNIKITGEGTAEITAVYNGRNYGSLTVTGNSDKAEKNGSGTGSGSSSGDGNGSSKGDGNKTGAGESNAMKGDTGKGLTALSQDQKSAQQIGSAGGQSSGSGDNNVKVYKISEADDVYVESRLKKSLLRILWAAGIASIALGAVIEVVYFRGQVYWAGKVIRMYKKYE